MNEQVNISIDCGQGRFRLIKTLWVMYVLFPFRLVGIGAIQNIIYYGLSISFIIVLLTQLYKNSTDLRTLKEVIIYFVILMGLTLLAYLVPIWKNTADISYLQYFGYYWGRIVVVSGTFILYRNFWQYLKLIIDAINTYVIFSLILLIPSIRSIYSRFVSINVTSQDQLEQLYSVTYYTRYGLQGFSGFGATLMCTIAVLFSCYLIVVEIHAHERVERSVLRVFIALVGTAMYGRIGLVVSLVVIFMMLVYLAIVYHRYAPLITTLIGTLIGLALLIINANNLEQISSINWILEGFFNFLNTGQFTTHSTTALSAMYIHPDTNTILFGDGYYEVMGRYYMATDVGFLRPLLFWGIFGEILYYAQLLPLLSSLSKRLKVVDGRFLIMGSLVLIVLYEFKGEALMTFGNMLYMIVAAMILNSRGQVGRLILPVPSEGEGNVKRTAR